MVLSIMPTLGLVHWDDPEGWNKGTLLLLLLLSSFSRVQLCATPQMAAHQAPPSLGFSRHGVAKSRKRLNDFAFTFHFHALEKEMPTNSSVLAWRIPGTGEPGGLPSMGLHRRRAPAERLLWPGRASPSASQLLAFSPGKEQAAGVWETRSPEGPRHLHRTPRLSEAPWEGP